MKKVILGTLVATIIYFLYQTVMWMGGFHEDFNSYSSQQESVMQFLDQSLTEDGLYMMPSADPSSPTKQQDEEKLMTEGIGKPWAMVFFHKRMEDMSAVYILLGLIYSFVGCLLVALILYHGQFSSFGMRFLVSMAFALFALSQGVLDEMNWWSYPWKFVKPQVIDLTFGWALCSVWLAWFVKGKTPKISN